MTVADITTDDDLWYELFDRDYLPKPEDRIAQDGKSVPPPEALVHSSISTCKNFEKMVDFYMTCFNARPINFRDKRDQGGGRAAFLSFDERDHRFAIIERPGWQEKQPKTVGLAHLALQYPNMGELLAVYKQMKAWGIAPVHVLNHGQSNSIYYHDPDGNEVETYIDSFATPEECTKFKHEIQYRPGTDYDMSAGVFDPDKMVELYESGIPEEVLRVREEVIRLKQEGKL